MSCSYIAKPHKENVICKLESHVVTYRQQCHSVVRLGTSLLHVPYLVNKHLPFVWQQYQQEVEDGLWIHEGAELSVISVDYSTDYVADNRCWLIIGGLR